MYHSITFYQGIDHGSFTNGRNSYSNWHLVSKSRLLFNPPKVKTKYIDIPGANGHIDMTDVLGGTPYYENREGSFEFYVLNDYPSGHSSWVTRYADIMNFLHGMPCKAILDDDPGYYYKGRFSVDSWGSDSSWSTITISYSVDPYKISISSASNKSL